MMSESSWCGFLAGILFTTFATNSCTFTSDSEPVTTAGQEIISVEYPEVYELANIVLALTDYGLSDPWQVRKGFPYYNDMMDHFSPFKDHPLIDSVNFSRERWQEYLSFRTDAYAFEFDAKDRLQRINEFQAFPINTFDQYLNLTEDFAHQSGFRDFFNAHEEYYSKTKKAYRTAYLIPEMKDFLSGQFDAYFADKKYSIVLSPFVYAQHLQREIDSTWAASFPAIAKPIIEGGDFENEEDKSTEMHVLFTEMNHGFVNPTTEQYPVREKFNESLWDDESGYHGGGTDVFNEYMTWAVFDLFNKHYFPEIAERVNLGWHFQNDARGFKYSHFFSKYLTELHAQYEGQKMVKHLYPEILEWANRVQLKLTKPTLLNDSDKVILDPNGQKIHLFFSEPMFKSERIDVVLQFGQWDKEVLKLNVNDMEWSKNGKKLSFSLHPVGKSSYTLFLNWWGVEKPVISEKGILLKASSGLYIVER